MNHERVRSAARAWLSSGLMLALLCSCADDGAAASDAAHGDAPSGVEAERNRAMNLVARVTVGDGAVSFYEPEPGTVLEVQTGRIGDTPPAGQDLSFSKRFELLAGAPAPRALVDAERRALALQQHPDTATDRAVTSPLQRDVAPQVFAQASAAGEKVTEEWFVASYCQQQDRFWGSQRLTGDSKFESGGLNYIKAGAYVYRGEVNYHLSATVDQTTSTYGLKAGFYAGMRKTSTVNRSASSIVTYADGDGYHHCVNYHF